MSPLGYLMIVCWSHTVLAAVFTLGLKVWRIPIPAVGLTLVRMVVCNPVQAVECVAPDLVGLRLISGTAHHLIANRSMACAPQLQAVLEIF